jgi:uncharacterized membrane protein (DUF373 family)
VVLTYYQSSVAFLLTLVIGVIILVAFLRLMFGAVAGLLLGARNPLDHTVFLAVFGEVMTLLIALEFNYTLQYVVTRQQSIIQTKVVLLIALLAIARKFIVLDLHERSPGHLIGLAGITVALGLTYWLIRDDRLAGGSNAKEV